MRIFWKKTYLLHGSLAILLIGFLLPLLAVGQKHTDDWKLEKNKNGIRVYSRYPTDSRLKEVKVQCEVRGTLAQLAAFISDIDRYPEVVYRVRNAYMVKRVNDREFYFYNETSMPWPAHNRDLVIHMLFQMDPATQTMRVQASNAPGMVPEKPGIVRVPFWHSLWTVTDMGEHRLRVEYAFRVDPGGELPLWLINATVAIGPYQSFAALEEHLKNPHYQGRTFSFLPPS